MIRLRDAILGIVNAGYIIDLFFGLTCHHLVHVLLSLCILVLQNLEQTITALGADASDLGIIRAQRNTDWGAIVTEASADTLKVLVIEDVVLVTLATTSFWLAGRAFHPCARSSVGLRVDDGEVRVATTGITGGT